MQQNDLIIEQLKSFSTKDYKAVQRLATKLSSGYSPLSTNDFKEIISSSNIYLFVVREPKDKRIVGMATLIVYRIPYIKKAYLDDLIVDEEYRGKGIGSQLLNKILATGKSLGASYIDFTSRPEKVEGNKFYKKLGFKKRDTNVYRLTFDYAEI